jgi:hypothetical protein
MWTRLRLAMVLVGGFLFLGGSNPIDPDELACEDAVHHLLDCCGGDDEPVAQIDCYAGRGCDQSTPQLSGPVASCLRDASCADVIRSGACKDPLAAVCE